MEQLIQWAWNFGLGIVLAIALVILLWRLLLYVMNTTAERERNYQNIISNHMNHQTEALNEICKRLTTHDEKMQQFFITEVREAHNRQREEHKEILDAVKE